MFVLGIDPGLSRCGYGCVGRDGATLRATAFGVLTSPTTQPLPARLAGLAAGLRTLIADLEPEVVAVERVFFQTNVRTAMSVGQASGLALAAASAAGCTVVEYTSNEVKESVAGYGAASKKQVQRMVQSLLRLGSRPTPDEADALALALAHHSRAPLLARIEAARTATAGEVTR